MYEQQLTLAGLNRDQARIYEILIKNGELSAGKICQKCDIKRGLVYKILDQLIALNLVEKDDQPEKVAKFRVNHPLKIKELAQKREQTARDAQLSLESVLPSLISDFNLLSGMPGVRYFEGINGFRQVLEDTLSSKTEILTIASVENLHLSNELTKIEQNYVRKRLQLGIKKKVINTYSNTRPNPPQITSELDQKYSLITETRYIKKENTRFTSGIQIYDNKISYQTFDNENFLGFIIESNTIYDINKNIFELLWDKLAEK